MIKSVNVPNPANFVELNNGAINVVKNRPANKKEIRFLNNFWVCVRLVEGLIEPKDVFDTLAEYKREP